MKQKKPPKYQGQMVENGAHLSGRRILQGCTRVLQGCTWVLLKVYGTQTDLDC